MAMKPIRSFIYSARLIVLLCILFFAFVSTAAAQIGEPHLASNAELPAFTHHVYLPMTGRCLTGKCISGMHLGNRTNDWSASFLHRIDPAQGGTWPGVVVVLSNQVYQINRYPSTDPTNPCRVINAVPRADRPVIWDYLRRAGQSNVRVVIRIWPSPGNFPDGTIPENWSNNHNLLRYVPAGPNGYCDPEHYRTVGDISDEMSAIHNVNINNGFAEFGFEPANEPNTEWYSEFYGAPRRFEPAAWYDMNFYFGEIYEYIHEHLLADIKLLTPPMAQSARAEGINLTTCDRIPLMGGIVGYEAMKIAYTQKSDGINWHNYWIFGREVFNECEQGGMHASYYFPYWLKNTIVQDGRPATITEADLFSPTQEGLQTISDKLWGNNPAVAAESIRHFISSENFYSGFGQMTASWLLVDNTNTPEHDWHEAIDEINGEREWFRLWYTGSENWP